MPRRPREGRSEATLGKNRWLLEPAFTAFGNRPIGEVTAPELLHALRKFELRSRYESAGRLRAVAGMVFRYAIATGRATRDISVDLRGALTTPKENHRAAITEPSEVGALLRAIFSRSFSIIRSDDLKSEIDRQYDARRFWPDALLSLNPRYLQGPTVDDLVASGDLDEATGKIFRFGSIPGRA